MFTDKRTVPLASSALAALVAMALSACAPVGADGYGNQPVAENAAAAGADESSDDTEGVAGTEDEASAEDEAATDEGDPAKAASENLTEELIAVKLPRMGKAVKDERGRLLYRFEKDSNDPAASNCNDECERAWPPAYTDGNPVVEGINEDLVGTVTRDDGTRQLTLDGWPLYFFAGDKKALQWAGQGVDGVWFVIKPNGKRNLECLPKGVSKAVAPPAGDQGQSDKKKSSSDDGGYSY